MRKICLIVGIFLLVLAMLMLLLVNLGVGLGNYWLNSSWDLLVLLSSVGGILLIIIHYIWGNISSRARVFFYIISLISIGITIGTYFANNGNFYWLLRGGVGGHWGWVFWVVMGKVLLFLPSISLIFSFFVIKKLYFNFKVFSIINLLLIPIQIFFLLLPSNF